MLPQSYRQLSDVEDRHWWHQSRLQLVARHLSRLALPPQAQILDVGCGTGGTTRFLAQYGTVTGIDSSDLALELARHKNPESVNFVKCDANFLTGEFEPHSFDLITFFNVIYHQWINDEEAVLTQVEQLLRPGGFVLLTEPAFKILTREHDRQVLGRTRYRLGDFKVLFNKSNLTYVRGHYFNSFAFPLGLIAGLFDRGGDQHSEAHDITEMKIPPRWVNKTLIKLIRVESWVNMFLPLPIGVTLLAIGKNEKTTNH